MTMTEDTLAAALARLERAIGRVELAFPARASGHVGIAEAYAQLDERHAALRGRVQETIERLDALIEQAG